jgi:hypothetical protein
VQRAGLPSAAQLAVRTHLTTVTSTPAPEESCLTNDTAAQPVPRTTMRVFTLVTAGEDTRGTAAWSTWSGDTPTASGRTLRRALALCKVCRRVGAAPVRAPSDTESDMRRKEQAATRHVTRASHSGPMRHPNDARDTAG